ncbi:MAG: FAD-dependent oxidoreductase [Chloroflexota bacterium]
MPGDAPGNNFPNLFQPGQIGRVKLKNRIVMLPMGTAHASVIGEVTGRTIAHYEARARGGVGLIIVGYVAVTGRETPNGLQIDGDWYTEGHASLVEAVHAWGTRIVAQLNQGGSRTIIACLEGRQPVSSSAIARYYSGGLRYPEPRALSREEIDAAMDQWAQAARRARQAGYDMAELHGAHGYLISQFISPYLNKRTDEFGGSLENRMRFPIELLKRIKKEVGEEYPVGIRLNGDEFWPGGITLDDSPIMAKMMEEAGAAYIELGAGTFESKRGTVDTMGDEEGWKLYLAEAVRKNVTIPVISGGSIKSPLVAEKALAEGKADFIGLARPLLADPEWPNKARTAQIKEIHLCVSCNECHPLASRQVGTVQVGHCSVNVALGREGDFDKVIPAEKRKKVMVVGGGPGGMEAAITAAQRGHDVTLYDRGSELGGSILLAVIPPGKTKWLWLRDYLKDHLEKAGVRVVLNTDVSPRFIEENSPDAVIVATGSQPFVPDIPGASGGSVFSARDVLKGKATLKGKDTAILGGGMVGCETAEYLAERGHKVTIIEVLPRLASDMEPYNRNGLMERLEALKVQSLVGKKVAEIDDAGVSIVDTNTGVRERVPAEQVILAMGAVPNDGLAAALEGKVPELYVVGDCVRPARVIDAMYEGAVAGRKI